jgi:creatinine amidohydrolase
MTVGSPNFLQKRSSVNHSQAVSKMKARPYILAETNWKTVKNTPYKIAVLPWGATEAHNYHLPYGTDNIQNEYIAAKAAEIAWNKGVKISVLPNIPFGVNSQQLDLKLTINMSPSTQFIVLRDVVDALYDQGIRKLVIFNGHGGNDFKQMIREITADYPDMFICQLNWYMTPVDWSAYFEDTGDHAGEMETSIMMNIVPEWVAPLSEAGDGKSKKLRFRGRSEGWLWAPREWTKVTRDTGIGNPAKSTTEKGKKCLDDVINKIAEFFMELNHTEIDDIYID